MSVAFNSWRDTNSMNWTTLLKTVQWFHEGEGDSPEPLIFTLLHLQCHFVTVWTLTSKRVKGGQRHSGWISSANQFTPATPRRKWEKSQRGWGRWRKKEVREERKEAFYIILTRLYYCSTIVCPPSLNFAVPILSLHFVGRSQESLGTYLY